MTQTELLEEWVEGWNNSDLRFCDVEPHNQVAWLTEIGNWLQKGRRWPMDPSDRNIAHCIYWWPKVERLMKDHGWRLKWCEDPLQGYLITWRHDERDLIVSGGGPSAHYAAITAAAIVRRKARYYNLWQSQNRHKERGCV